MVWEKRVHTCLFVCPCSCNYLCVVVTLRGKESKKERRKSKRKRERARKTESGWRIVSVFAVVLCCAATWCVALRRDNRMPALLAYLCCTPHSCFCCLPLPAKSHPAATWGQRSAPPGLCSSSSGRGQITNTNHLLILVIKETLITTELRSSAALNGHKQTISETKQHATTVHPIFFFCVSVFVWWPGDKGCTVIGVVTNGCKNLYCIKKEE